MMPQMNELGNPHEIPSNAQKKRILFVITQSEIGGAQQFLAQLISSLDSTMLATVVTGSDGLGELKKLLPPETMYHVAQNLKRNPSPWSDFLSLSELRRIYKQERPDIIFLNSSKAGFNGSIAAWGLPSRVIYRIGGWSFNDPRPGWQKAAIRFLERLSAPWKDDIVVNNQRDLDDARQYNIKPRKQVHLIHNGIDPYQEFMSKDEARLKLQNIVGNPALFQSKFLIGTIANFYPTKGLFDLIEAAEIVTEATFVIIGDGFLREELESEISRRGLSNRVILVGRINTAAQYLPAFNLCTLPSLKEGFPWVILEAMAAKVPIIATSVGALPEILEHERSGVLVPPGSPQELARAINRIMNDEELGREMTIQAHQKLLQQFNLRTMIGKYEKLFKAI